MGIRKYKPTSAGRRFQTGHDFAELTTEKPYAPLCSPIKKTGGRCNTGRVTVWQRGGGSRRLYRQIDFKRDKRDVPGRIETIEYDPNRSSRIALVLYADGERRYIIAPVGLAVGDTVMAGESPDVKVGNAMPMRSIPLGTFIHNIEVRPGGGGKIARSAGAQVQLVAKEGDYSQVKLGSGEMRKLPIACMATIGQVGNVEHENISLGKAGRRRWLGRRSIVRGVAMNPIDHPLGGGEGKSSGGRPPCSPWGKPEGVKTRSNKRTDKYIVRRRKK
jgi:large subunit ribosomal protein L2